MMGLSVIAFGFVESLNDPATIIIMSLLLRFIQGKKSQNRLKLTFRNCFCYFEHIIIFFCFTHISGQRKNGICNQYAGSNKRNRLNIGPYNRFQYLHCRWLQMDFRNFRSDLTSLGFHYKLLSPSDTSHIQVVEIPVKRVAALAVRWPNFNSG